MQVEMTDVESYGGLGDKVGEASRIEEVTKAGEGP
jgi:hypothetical protein